MKKDEEHKTWRKEHGLSEDYESMREVAIMIKRILEILQLQQKG